MHEHEHHPHEECHCGHKHHHEEECGCGHEHHHEEHHDHAHREIKGAQTLVYTIEGLDCANCAAKIEAKIRNLPEIAAADLTFATMQLRISARPAPDLLVKLQAAADSIEDGVTIVPKQTGKVREEAEDEEDEKNALPKIILGAVLFVIGEVLERMGAPLPALLGVLIIAYGILGGKVLLTAGRNIRKGQVFDENFLMSIATLGAFAIGEYPEAVGVMLFYQIGEYFQDRAVAQSRAQIMEAVDMRPEVVNRMIDGEVQVIGAEEAQVGDRLLVRPGDRIPLDGVILEGESRIDTSPVTGEPVPVKAGVGDSVISGCVNTSGQLMIRVEKPLAESMVTKILDAVENAAASKPNIDKFITRFARVYTPIVVFSALAVAFVLPLILPGWHFFVNPGYTGAVNVIYGSSGTASILTALTFLVISCPCALVLSVPLAFFSGIGAASKKGILFKGGNAIEALSGVKAVVMDKTGTVTKGNFRVQAAIPADESMTPNTLLQIAASCELSSTHPIAVSIVNAAGEMGLETERPSELKEIPGHGIEAKIAAGTVLCGNRKLMAGKGIDLSGYEKTAFGSEVLVALNGRFIGNIQISDTLKEDAVAAIAGIKKQGIVTAMLTGDAQDSADYIARQTGIDEVHARLLPENKLTALQNIRKVNGRVMFVGDGINDAPVLAGADVGAAMGSGADAAIEAADVVFMTSEMAAIPNAIKIAKDTRRIAWQNVYFALAVKLLVMIMGLLGFANMWIAVFADTGVALLCLLNSVRILRMK